MVQQSKKFIPFNWDWKPEEIIEHAHQVDWDTYFEVFRAIDKDFIGWETINQVSQYFNDSNWRHVAAIPNLPEDFIRLHQENLDWDIVTVYNTNLSRDFCREFKDKLNWIVREIVFQNFWKKNKDLKEELGLEYEERRYFQR